VVDQGEHRGWEIENDYHPHYLDDASFVFDGEEERSSSWFGVALLLAGALCASAWALDKWLEPPPVVFPPPQIVVSASPPSVPLLNCKTGRAGATCMPTPAFVNLCTTYGYGTGTSGAGVVTTCSAGQPGAGR